VRFVLDHNVDSAVVAVLLREGHEAWTAGSAGLGSASDDELTAYADDQRAALLTHDVEFSRRRQLNVVGQHVWLRCTDLDAPALVARRLPEIVKLLEHHDHVWMRVSSETVSLAFRWE
jgi:predicted nuclease of predicted toxin-antitoxin system